MNLLIIRLLVIILFVWVGFKLVRFVKQRQGEVESSANHAAKSSQLEADVIVPCNECGTHLPQASALKEGERYFCCRAHLVEFQQASKESNQN